MSMSPNKKDEFQQQLIIVGFMLMTLFANLFGVMRQEKINNDTNWYVIGTEIQEQQSGSVYTATLQNRKKQEKLITINERQYDSTKIGDTEEKIQMMGEWTVTGKTKDETKKGSKYQFELQNEKGNVKTIEVTKEKYDSIKVQDKIEL